jgi:hypothetical protein
MNSKRNMRGSKPSTLISGNEREEYIRGVDLSTRANVRQTPDPTLLCIFRAAPKFAANGRYGSIGRFQLVRAMSLVPPMSTMKADIPDFAFVPLATDSVFCALRKSLGKAATGYSLQKYAR